MKKFLTDMNNKKTSVFGSIFCKHLLRVEFGIEKGKQIFRMNNFEIFKSSRIFLKPEVQKD